MYLVLPLASSLLYVVGALFVKQASGHGIGVWRISFVANLACAVLFSFLWPMGGQVPAWSLLWQPALIGALFVLGQTTSFLAIERGDVSVATPILGVKVVLVAIFATAVLGTRVTPSLWLAAIFCSAGIAFLNRKPKHGPRKKIGVTIALSFLAAAAYAMFDILVQKWSPAWGAGRMLPFIMWFAGLFSFAFVPLFRASVFAIPKPAIRPLLLGALFIALQGIILINALAWFGEATSVNVVYGMRGLWSVMAVWWFGHLFGNTEREQGGDVLLNRLLGAAMLVAAVVLLFI